ncbi:MAG: glycosyltransferase family 4 protein [Gammaproteobacteria bacterium]
MDTKLKYLVMTADRFPPNRVDVRVLFGEELAVRGHEVDWLMQSDRPLKRNGVQRFGNGTAWIGAAVAGNSTLAKALRQLQAFFNDFRVFSLALRNRYDCIQVKDKFIGALLGLIAARLSGAKFVYWLAFPFPEAWLQDAREGTSPHPLVDRVRGWISGVLLYRLILPCSDLTFVQSDEMKRVVAAKGIPADRMFAVPMGVSVGLLSTGGETKSELVRSPAVLYLGSMLPIRRLNFVLESFVRVLEVVPNATLYMVGGERAIDIEVLRAEAKRLHIANRVVFTGSMPRDEALKWTRSADVCVSPLFPTPIFDLASSTKLVEYMALGKAVVGNRHPDQGRVIDESGGGLCVPYEVRAFADAIITLLKDPERARAMGEQGRKYVAQFRSYPRIADGVASIYESIVGANATDAK